MCVMGRVEVGREQRLLADLGALRPVAREHHVADSGRGLHHRVSDEVHGFVLGVLDERGAGRGLRRRAGGGEGPCGCFGVGTASTRKAAEGNVLGCCF